MGKIKRSKTSRIHQKANFKSTDEESKIFPVKTNAPNHKETSKQKPPETNVIALEQNPFSGININVNNLFKQSLAEKVPVIKKDEKAVTQKPKTDTVERKKNKMKRRKEEFLKKLSASYAAEAERKKNKARGKVPVVGNMVQLKEALPMFQPTNQQQEKKIGDNKDLKDKPTQPAVDGKKALHSTVKPQITKPKKMKQRKKQKLELLEIQKFQNLLKTGGIKSVNLKELNMT